MCLLSSLIIVMSYCITVRICGTNVTRCMCFTLLKFFIVSLNHLVPGLSSNGVTLDSYCDYYKLHKFIKLATLCPNVSCCSLSQSHEAAICAFSLRFPYLPYFSHDPSIPSLPSPLLFKLLLFYFLPLYHLIKHLFT